MKADWDQRACRLSSIVEHADIAGDYTLVKAVRLSHSIFSRLEGAVITYVWHNLVQAFPDISCTPSATLLEEYANPVLTLPNRTPNGVLLPRRETFLSFNLIHQALAGVVQSFGATDKFSKIQIPCNVRIVHGAPDGETEARPYASSKIHTDVWAGEPLSSILFNIPVLGDPTAVDLRFFEPQNFPPQLMRSLTDYELGSVVASNCTEYPLQLEMGMAYISDALSLHKTVKRRPRLRLSIDFRAIAEELLPDETSEFATSRATYVSVEAWRSAGYTTILSSGEPLDSFQRRRRGETIVRTNPSFLDIDDASD